MMNRIIWHWAASTYAISADAHNRYHFNINGAGEVVPGRHRVEANAPGQRLQAGKYAAHVLNLNSGSIGNSVAGMHGAREVPFSVGNFPMTELQIESLINLTVNQVRNYNIPVTKEHVLSHAEVQPTLGVRQNNKWDFMWLPGMSFPRYSVEVGDMLRERVLKQLGNYRPSIVMTSRPMVRRGNRGPDVKDLQEFLKISADGIFGPITEKHVIRFQASRQLRPDGIVGPMTWAAIGI
jgi:N-acetyl-anhydromuramyl-L-alanine amidase AmpD